MKNAKRIFAVVLCLILVASAFCGCTININVTHTNGAAADTTAAPTTEAPTTAAPTTAAPTTEAPTTAAPPLTEGGDTTAAPIPPESNDTTAAPAPTEAPASSDPSTPEEILNVYKEVYKNTKADGNFRGTSHMSCTSVMIDGKENSMVRSAADKFMGGENTGLALCPDSEGVDYNECDATVDDITSATWKDNGDGTATLEIKPKETVNGKKFTSSSGKFFDVMEDVASSIADISLITWAQGDANSNTTLTTSGTVTVTYDKATMKMTKATYDLITVADVQHVNVLIFKDKNGTATFDYCVEFPT